MMSRRFVQAEIENGERREHFFVEIFGGPIFLRAELDIFPMNLDVGFQHPMLAVKAFALEQKRVRPIAPTPSGVQMPLRAADGNIHLGDAAAQTHATRLRVAFEKFAVRHATDDDKLIFHARMINRHDGKNNFVSQKGTKEAKAKIFLREIAAKF